METQINQMNNRTTPARQTARQTASQPARQPARQPSRQTARQTDSQTDSQPARQPARQPSRQTASQTDRQPSRQTDRTKPILETYLSEIDFSKLNISIVVRNKIIQTFKPRMINRYASYNQIFFIPTIPMTLDDLKNSGVINKKNSKLSDFINVFTSLYELTSVLKYIRKNKTFNAITFAESEEYDFVKKDISLILDIFFNKDNKLTYEGRDYPIFSYFWNGTYQRLPTQGNYPNFLITIELEILDSDKVGSETDRQNYQCYSVKKRFGLIDETDEQRPLTPSLFRSGPITIKSKRGGKKSFKRHTRRHKTRRHKTRRHKAKKKRKINKK
jgi:hypothetical protein